MAATAMGKVGKAEGRRTENVVGDGTSVRKGSESKGEQRGRGMELVVDGPRVEKEMHCWVEAGGWGR